MECLVRIVNGFQPFTIFPKHSITDVWQDSKYAYNMGKLNIKKDQMRNELNVYHGMIWLLMVKVFINEWTL